MVSLGEVVWFRHAKRKRWRCVMGPNNGCKGDLASYCDNSKQSQRFIYNLDIPAQSNSCDLRVPFLMQYVDIDRKSKTP